jgi:hypothetical protein
MGIIGNIRNNIIIMYELKSFFVTLAVGKFFPNNIHQVNYHFTHSKNWKKKSIIPPYYRWVVLCTVKDLKSLVVLSSLGARKLRKLTERGVFFPECWLIPSGQISVCNSSSHRQQRDLCDFDALMGFAYQTPTYWLAVHIYPSLKQIFF